MRWFYGLVFPVTKAKLKRLFHVVGLLVMVAVLVAIWLPRAGLNWTTQLSETLVVVTLLLTNAKAAFKAAEGVAGDVIDNLPLPDGSDATANVVPVVARVPEITQSVGYVRSVTLEAQDDTRPETPKAKGA